MDFSEALEMLKRGYRMRRKQWSSPEMYVCYQRGYPDGIAINANTAIATGLPEGTVCRFQPYLMMRRFDQSFMPWNPAQSDLLSDDWEPVD
jgi:Protein of unknown function (DUF2829)